MIKILAVITIVNSTIPNCEVVVKARSAFKPRYSLTSHYGSACVEDLLAKTNRERICDRVLTILSGGLNVMLALLTFENVRVHRSKRFLFTRHS